MCVHFKRSIEVTCCGERGGGERARACIMAIPQGFQSPCLENSYLNTGSEWISSCLSFFVTVAVWKAPNCPCYFHYLRSKIGFASHTFAKHPKSLCLQRQPAEQLRFVFPAKCSQPGWQRHTAQILPRTMACAACPFSCFSF